MNTHIAPKEMIKREAATRTASQDDLKNILTIENSCFHEEAFSRRQMAYLISQAKGIFYVATVNDASGKDGGDSKDGEGGKNSKNDKNDKDSKGGKDDEMAGYISMVTSSLHHTGRIYSIAVAPQYRGHGVAMTLLERALEYAKEMGLRAIFLEVRIENSAAISLYKKYGFSERAIKKDYYGPGGDALSMYLDFPI